MSTTNVTASSDLPACAFDVDSLYRPCACGNSCVAFIALSTPLVLLLAFALCQGACFSLTTLFDAFRYPQLSLALRAIAFSSLRGEPVDLEQQSSIELKERLALAAIQSLPSAVWGGHHKIAAECSLCMDIISTGSIVRKLQCGHLYHLRCIDTWLIRGQRHHPLRQCPLCRQDPLSLARQGDSHACAGRSRSSTTSVCLPVMPTSVELLEPPWKRRWRRFSEGASRHVIGSQQPRRHSSPRSSNGARVQSTAGDGRIELL